MVNFEWKSEEASGWDEPEPEESPRFEVPSVPVTRREALYYLLFATLLLFMIFLSVLALWMVTPRPLRVELARSDFPPSETPYKVTEGDVVFWLVHVDGRYFAFNALTPHDRTRRCEYDWNVANGRFEDPCLGAKFTLDGAYIDGPALRSLDRYRLRVNAEQLVVDISTVIPGAPVEESVPPDGR